LNSDLDAQAVWSPDKSFIVFRDVKDDWVDLFKIDSNGENLQQLTTSAEQELCPALARNKSGVYFILQNMPESNQNGLFYKAPDFALSAQVIEGIFQCVDFKSDGFHLAISSNNSNGWNIYSGSASPNPQFLALTNEGNNFSPDWYRDFSRIVYISELDGQTAISIINSDGTGKRVVPNTPNNPQHPRWMP
jgi:Tol biopolymer transport system component